MAGKAVVSGKSAKLQHQQIIEVLRTAEPPIKDTLNMRHNRKKLLYKGHTLRSLMLYYTLQERKTSLLKGKMQIIHYSKVPLYCTNSNLLLKTHAITPRY